jgi:hypothetical protein
MSNIAIIFHVLKTTFCFQHGLNSVCAKIEKQNKINDLIEIDILIDLKLSEKTINGYNVCDTKI